MLSLDAIQALSFARNSVRGKKQSEESRVGLFFQMLWLWLPETVALCTRQCCCFACIFLCEVTRFLYFFISSNAYVLCSRRFARTGKRPFEDSRVSVSVSQYYLSDGDRKLWPCSLARGVAVSRGCSQASVLSTYCTRDFAGLSTVY
jgi:hypothetical protein